MSLNLGVIGFGNMASHWHAEIPTQLPEVNLAAVYDIDPKRLEAAKEKGYRTYNRLEEFLKDDEVNFVLVATPNHLHKPLAIQVMEAGKNVMVEKPATLTADDWAQMMAVSQSTGKILTVHHNRRWDLDYLTMKRTLQTGLIGKPYAITSAHQQWRKLFGEIKWRDVPEYGGGFFYDWGVHLCDQVLNIDPTDPVKSVYMQMKCVNRDLVDDFAKLQLTMQSGLFIEVYLSTFVLKPMPRWSVYGDRGTFVIDDFGCHSGSIRTIDYEKAHSLPAAEGEPVELPLPVVDVKNGITREDEREAGNGAWVELYRNLADVVDNGAELIVRPEQVLRTMKLLDAAFQSARTNEVIHVQI